MIELTDTNSSEIAAEFVRARTGAGSPAMGMVMTLVIVVDEAGAAGRDGRRPGGLPRAPGPGARRDPGRRPRRGARCDAQVGIGDGWSGETALIRLSGRGRQAPRVRRAAAAAARLPRRGLVARRPPRRPGGRPARAAGPAADHRRRRRLARQDQGAARRSARRTPRATPTWPGPGSRPWRALLAAALDQQPAQGHRGPVTAERISPSADLLMAWLSDRLRVPGRRARTRPGRASPRSRMETREGPIRITRDRRQAGDVLLPGSARPAGRAQATRPPRAAGRGAAPARRGRRLRGGRAPAGQADRRRAT